MITKDATIHIRFLTEEEGGRHTSIRSDNFGCPIMIDENRGFDCRFVLDGITLFELGNEYEISIGFLNSECAIRSLSEGDEIFLWEGKKIGVGTMTKIFSDLKN